MLIAYEKLRKINILLANGWRRLKVPVWRKNDDVFLTAEKAYEEHIKTLTPRDRGENCE